MFQEGVHRGSSGAAACAIGVLRVCMVAQPQHAVNDKCSGTSAVRINILGLQLYSFLCIAMRCRCAGACWHQPWPGTGGVHGQRVQRQPGAGAQQACSANRVACSHLTAPGCSALCCWCACMHVCMLRDENSTGRARHPPGSNTSTCLVHSWHAIVPAPQSLTKHTLGSSHASHAPLTLASLCVVAGAASLGRRLPPARLRLALACPAVCLARW